MQVYEASATVQPEGEVRVAGVPFAPGTEVEVTISPKRAGGEHFAAAWKRFCAQLRSAPNTQNLSDDDIQDQIEEYRAGR
jgi:hypothetical protein